MFKLTRFIYILPSNQPPPTPHPPPPPLNTTLVEIHPLQSTSDSL